MYERDFNPIFGALNIVELILIIFMIVEYIITFACMRITFINLWNILDLVAIVVLIALYIADVTVSNYYASAVFKTRALLRMPKITLLVIYIFSPQVKFPKK